MARKRPRIVTDFEKIGEEPSTSADVHGVIKSLSPLKKGRKSGAKYFDGCVSDEFASFSEKQFDVIEKFKGKESAVELNFTYKL